MGKARVNVDGERKPSTRRNREAEVIDAAVAVFYAKGYSSASIKDVADAVGVLKGSLYHYISSKEDLLLRIFSSSHAQAMQVLQGIRDQHLPPREELETYLTDIALWFLRNIERVSLYFNEWRYLTGDNAVIVRRQRRQFSDYFLSNLAEAQRQGLLRPGTDVKLASYYILGAVNNIPVWYRNSGEFSARRVAKNFAAMSVNMAYDS